MHGSGCVVLAVASTYSTGMPVLYVLPTAVLL